MTTITMTNSTSNSSSAVLSVSTVALPVNIDEYVFNKANTPVTLQLSHPILDVESYVLFTNQEDKTNATLNSTMLNIVNTTSTNSSITIVNGFPASRAILICLIAQDIYGLPIFTSFFLYFGNISMPVRVFFANGTLASGVSVQMNLTDDSRISQQGVTNDFGIVFFENVPPITVSLFAHTIDNQIGLSGVSPSLAGINITLIPFVSASVTRKRRQSGNNYQWLSVNTNMAYNLQMKVASFTSAAGATQIYVEYRFITQEIPGGYFGTQFNDYFSITLRSSTGNYRTVSQSMNGLGLGAFDFQSGTTAWMNLTMQVGPQPEEIEIVIGVSNVVDNLFQSQVDVDKYGSDKCDNNICDKNCSMEAETECGLDGYALGYGFKYCTMFVNSINSFTSKGQTWVYSTMNCLQKALVSPLQSCEKNCETLKNLAFSSHPSCYVNNGVCDLPPLDWVTLLTIVGKDLLTYDGLVQALNTGPQCIPDLIMRMKAAVVETLDLPTRLALLILSEWSQSL
jgi:hypothetical protein